MLLLQLKVFVEYARADGAQIKYFSRVWVLEYCVILVPDRSERALKLYV